MDCEVNGEDDKETDGEMDMKKSQAWKNVESRRNTILWSEIIPEGEMKEEERNKELNRQ